MADHIQTPEEVRDDQLRGQAANVAIGCGCASLMGFAFAAFVLVTAFQHGRDGAVMAGAVGLVGVGACVAGTIGLRLAKTVEHLAWGARREQQAGGWGGVAHEVAVDADAVAALVQLGFAKASAEQAVARERRSGAVDSGDDAAALIQAVLARRK